MKQRSLLFALIMLACWMGAGTGCSSPESQQEKALENLEELVEVQAETAGETTSETPEKSTSDNRLNTSSTDIKGKTDFEWGAGILVPATDRIPSETMNFPDGSVPLLDSPNAVEVGELSKKSDWSLTANTSETGEFEVQGRPPFVEVTYEGQCLIFHQRFDNHVSVWLREDDPQYYIPIQALENIGLYPMTWMEFLLFESNDFFPRPEGGLNLRDAPKVTGKKVVTMKGDLYCIRPTGKTEGQWLEAKVLQWKEHPCSGEEVVLNTYTGWFKAIDDTGHPNIWFYTRGC